MGWDKDSYIGQHKERRNGSNSTTTNIQSKWCTIQSLMTQKPMLNPFTWAAIPPLLDQLPQLYTEHDIWYQIFPWLVGLAILAVLPPTFLWKLTLS